VAASTTASAARNVTPELKFRPTYELCISGTFPASKHVPPELKFRPTRISSECYTDIVRVFVLAANCVGNVRSERVAGPVSTEPAVLYVDPWHGQT